MCSRKRHDFSERKDTSMYIQRNVLGELICYKCLQYKPKEEFDDNSEMWYRDFKERRCKECKHKSYLKRRATYRGKKDLNRILLERYHGMLDRVKYRNEESNITLDYLKYLWNAQNGKCALSGLDMTYVFNGGRVPTNISIDKIDRTKGYIMGNIRLVCNACNQAKSDMTDEQLYFFCKKIIEHYESQNNIHSK